MDLVKIGRLLAAALEGNSTKIRIYAKGAVSPALYLSATRVVVQICLQICLWYGKRPDPCEPGLKYACRKYSQIMRS